MQSTEDKIFPPPPIIQYWKERTLLNLSEEINGIVYSEEWRGIPNYEGLYKASSFGRILDTQKNKIHYQRLRLTGKRNGHQQMEYCETYLRKNGNKRFFSVHRICLISFSGEAPTGKHITMHRNDIPFDNRSINLKWGTYQQNVIDCHQKKRNNTDLSLLKDMASRRRKNQKTIESVNVTTEEKTIHHSLRRACKELHISSSIMVQVSKGEINNYKGYRLNIFKLMVSQLIILILNEL